MAVLNWDDLRFAQYSPGETIAIFSGVLVSFGLDPDLLFDLIDYNYSYTSLQMLYTDCTFIRWHAFPGHFWHD